MTRIEDPAASLVCGIILQSSKIFSHRWFIVNLSMVYFILTEIVIDDFVMKILENDKFMPRSSTL